MKILLIACSFLVINFKVSATQCVGVFDVAHPTEGLQGWAYDPDISSASVTIHFYANAPAGTPGSVLIGSTVANYPRPDVNAAFNISGNHGFLWYMPFTYTTPCRLLVYAYAIDLNGGSPNPNLNNSPRWMPFLEGYTSQTAGNSTIQIRTSSKYAGSVYSVIWGGKEFINADDHGRLLQTASSFYSFPGSWTAECYNPTEAGSNNNGNSDCTDSRILDFSNSPTYIYNKTQMAFYASPGAGQGTASCPTAVNTIVTSSHILEKTVTTQVPNIPHAFKYQVTYHIPSDETNLGIAQFEVVTGYMRSEFISSYRYNQFSQTLTNTSLQPDGEATQPIIFSTKDGRFAMGVYSQEIHSYDDAGQGYGQFRFPSGGTYKWNLVRRLGTNTAYPAIIPGNSYSFTAYICVGSLENVRVTLGQLIATYPN